MAPSLRWSRHYDLLPRSSSECPRPSFDTEDGSFQLERPSRGRIRFFRLPFLPFLRRSQYLRFPKGWNDLIPPRRRRNRVARAIFWALVSFLSFLATLVLLAAILLPSYTHPPSHYRELQQKCLNSTAPGRANTHNEKVFIAASIHDEEGSLVGGAWGEKVIELVDLLGPDNVFLSVYQNDPDQGSKDALDAFQQRVSCNASLVAEHLPLDNIPRVTTPSGERLIKRIAYLAEVRNRALRPLERDGLGRFDKLLFINDVVFEPVDAAQLLLSTNIDAFGKTQYRAACGVDFINPFKFYDTFATRDLEGYSMALPFFPWFGSAGLGDSRKDVLSQSDAVRVRSCWGGMIAFEAKWFQEGVSGTDSTTGPPDSTNDVAGNITSGARFRSETDTYWDASECCLINADIQRPRDPSNPSAPSGIYMNPYIRVAYDETAFRWLRITRRPERLYTLFHTIISRALGMPYFNPRRGEEPGDEVTERVWHWNRTVSDDDAPDAPQTSYGYYEEVKRIAQAGRFCGGRKLLVLNENAKEGESRWQRLPAPRDT